MSDYKIVERDNPLVVHALTWSEERARYWIERYGDSGIFTDKTLSKTSFIIVSPTGEIIDPHTEVKE